VEILLLIVGLMLAAVVLVGVGDRLRLPWPALMVVLGIVVAFVPGLPDSFDLDPDLILPLLLPPLLFATAQRTSWALFRARWRTIAFLAVALVALTVAAVAGTAAALVPGLGLTGAVALGAMVAPPDPVAVEAVAGPVQMPRRLLSVLQSEGLFNDATALVIFQAAVLATVQDTELRVPLLLLQFVVGALGAVVLGLVVAWVARQVSARVTDATGRSALTLVLPFAVYLAAEEVHASGVVAVVVVALQMRATSDADEAEERLVQRSFWDVVEMLVTGVAFGLIGLDLRLAVEAAETGLAEMLLHAAVVVAVVFAVRALWMVGAWSMLRRSPDVSAAPRTKPEAVVLTWCGMRGLATLALALSLPEATASGAASRRGRRWWSSPARCWWRRCSCRGSRCRRWSGRWAWPRTPARSTPPRRWWRGGRGRRPSNAWPRRNTPRTCPTRCRRRCTTGWAGCRGCCAANHRPRTTATGSRRSAGAGTSCSASRTRRWPRRGPRCWRRAASRASTRRPRTAC
jgi:Na+/H+ antiporter